MVKYIENLVSEIYDCSKVPFQLIIDGSGVYSSKKFKEEESYIQKKSSYRNIKYSINVSEQYKFTINLLMFYIENKLNDLIMKKQNIVFVILKNENVAKEVILNVWPNISKKFKLINIYMEKYNEKIFYAIKEEYENTNIDVILYDNNILIIGDFKDPLEYAKNIKAKINNEYCRTCYISYCEVDSYLELKKSYDKTLYKLQLAIKYNIKESIFDEKKLLLEGIIDSISDEMKDEILNGFSDKILELDKEMIRTIEAYFKCGLNLSDAARELYIHRNTLIYRLDKIQKITSYDIRDFNNAMLFKIIFSYIGIKM